jgi:3-oxoadipate enol-lactonase
MTSRTAGSRRTAAYAARMTQRGPDAVVRDVDARPVAWREAGPAGGEPVAAGGPVAFLHGLGGSRTAWDPQLAALGERRRCLAWDMPGYGSSAPLPVTTFPALADAAVAWLGHAASLPAHLVGLSMGGMVALHTALAHPAAVKTLVLLDTSPAFGLDGVTTVDAWVEARLAPLRDGETPASMAPRVLRAIAGPDADDDVLDAAAAAMARISPAAFEQAVRCLPTHDVRGRLHEIRVPTLVLVGEHDAETPLPYSDYLARHVPDARLRVVAGAGHLTNTERPDAVNELIAEFLEEHDT